MKRILIVDDNEENLYLLRVLLEGHGYEVEQAANGSEALVKALAGKQDLIISDILMPVMDGFTFCRVLKADDRLKNIPLIFYTATYIDSKDEKLALDMGANAFLIKPMEPDEFMRRIEDILAANKDGKLSASQKQTAGDEVILKEYNEVLINKLEQKMLSLEQTNKALETEIAARKQAEEAIVQKELDWKKTFDSSNDMIWLLDSEQRVVRSNNTAERFLQRPCAEIVGIHCWEIVHGTTAPIPECPLLRAKKNLRRESMELQIGDDWFIVTVDPILDANGQYDGAVHMVRDITERKRLQDQLFDSLAKLQLTIDEAPVCVAMVGTDKRFLECNKSFCDFLGYSAEELKGKTIAEITFPDDREVGMEDLRAILADEKKTSRVQKRYVRKDGRVVWGEVTISLIRDKQGNPLYFLPIIQDITDRKQADDERFAALSRFSGFADASQYGMGMADMDGRITFVNATLTHLLGEKTAEDCLGKHFPTAYYPPSMTKKFQEEILPTLMDVGHWHGELELQTADGRIVTTEENYFVIHDSQGRICNFADILTDITERKQAEAALLESERKFRETVLSLDEGYYSVTLDGVLLDHNRAFSRILGFDQVADLKGRKMPDFWENPDDRNVYLKEFAAKGSISNYEANAKTKTGEKITVILSSHLVKDKNSVPLRIEGVVLNITERKRLENELRTSEARLRTVINSTPFPMAVVDVEDDKIEYWSHSALELFGHTAPTTTEWYQLAYPDPEYRQEVIGRWKPFLEMARLSGIPVNTGEYRVTCHDGTERLCELYATFLSDKLIVTFNDVTERKKVENFLRLKNHVFDTSIAANSIADFEGIITEANDAFLQIWGYSSKDEVVGHPVPYFFIDPEEAVSIVNALNEYGKWQGNFTAKKKNGSTFIAHCIATCLRDNNGNLIGYQSSVMNITEHKKAEQDILEKEVQYRNLADTGLALIWTAGTDKLCYYFNQPWLTFTGRTLEQELGNGWTEGVHPYDLDNCVKIYVTAFDKREAFDMEYRLRHASGEYHWIRDLGTPNYNVSGEFIGYIGHCFDINIQKKAEEEIRILNENLEQRIKERTAELRENMNLLEETNRAFVGRELRMIELKERIAELEKKT